MTWFKDKYTVERLVLKMRANNDNKAPFALLLLGLSEKEVSLFSFFKEIYHLASRQVIGGLSCWFRSHAGLQGVKESFMRIMFTDLLGKGAHFSLQV